jgi:hypothetical protein
LIPKFNSTTGAIFKKRSFTISAPRRSGIKISANATVQLWRVPIGFAIVEH